MRSRLGQWLRNLWQRKFILVALALYKVAEDRVLGFVNGLLDSLLNSPRILDGVFQLLPVLTWLAIPITIAMILLMAYRDTRPLEISGIAHPPQKPADSAPPPGETNGGLRHTVTARGTVSYPKPQVIHDAPEEVRAQHLRSFCEQRQSLVGTGQGLLRDLWAVPDNAGRSESQVWSERVKLWRASVEVHRGKWWSNDTSRPKPAKIPGLHPTWRGELIGLVQGGLDWFAWHGTACDRDQAPSNVVRP